MSLQVSSDFMPSSLRPVVDPIHPTDRFYAVQIWRCIPQGIEAITDWLRWGPHGLLPSEQHSVCGFLQPASCLAAPIVRRLSGPSFRITEKRLVVVATTFRRRHPYRLTAEGVQSLEGHP